MKSSFLYLCPELVNYNKSFFVEWKSNNCKQKETLILLIIKTGIAKNILQHLSSQLV